MWSLIESLVPFHFFIDTMKQVAGLLSKMRLYFYFLPYFQAFVGGPFIGRPFGQTGAVGVSGGGKAYPVVPLFLEIR